MPEEKLNPNDTLSKVLAYVDSPFKLIAILVMGVVAFAGYFVYSNQELLIGAYKENRKLPSINEERVEDAAGMLFKQTPATVVAVFKVNPLFGSRVLHRAYTREGRDKSVEGIDVGLFTSNAANNHDVIKLMANETPCGEYLKPQSEVGLWYTAQGVAFTCRTSVPPELSRFVGQITVGFKSEPEDLSGTVSMMEIAATMLTKRSP
jgi:hypothetical protein